MHVAAAQPAQLAAAQPGPGHQQHDQPIPRRAARPQQRDDILVAGPFDRTLRFVQPVPGPHPPRHPAVLAPGRRRQIPVVGHLIQQRHQMPTRLALGDRVDHHRAHRGQHTVDPPGPARRRTSRPGQHDPRRRSSTPEAETGRRGPTTS